MYLGLELSRAFCQKKREQGTPRESNSDHNKRSGSHGSPTHSFNWKYIILKTFTGKSHKTYIPRKKKVLQNSCLSFKKHRESA